MTELILTTTERMRMHEDQRIAAEYRAMRAANPGTASFRIIRSLAASAKFRSKSVAGIRAALVRTGEIKPATRKHA